jgi:hypothetical protein
MFSSAIDMGLHGQVGVLAFGNENLERPGAYGRLLLRLYQIMAFNGLCGISQTWNTTNTTISPVLMLPPTQSIEGLLAL